MTGTEITIFSYTDLAPAIRQDVECRTAAIRDRFARQTTDAIASGRDLIEIKSKLDHGQWLTWLATEFPSTPRTAQRFMAAAEWMEGKNDTVSHLPITTVYLLSSPSTPPEITAEVVADLEAGKKVDTAVIKEKIAKAKRPKRAADIAPAHLGKRATKRQEREVRQAVDVGGAVLAHTAMAMADKCELLPLSLEDAETLDTVLNRVSKDIRRLRQRLQDVKLSRPVLTEKGQKLAATIETDCIDVTAGQCVTSPVFTDARGRRYPEKPLDECMGRGLEQLANTIEVLEILMSRPDANGHADEVAWIAEIKKARTRLSRLENKAKRKWCPATLDATCTDVTAQQDDTGAGLFE